MEPSTQKTYEELLAEVDSMRWQLDEATDTIQAIRTGQIDALVVNGNSGPQLYSLKTADHTYRVFIEQMNEGALTLNDEGLILYCNSSFARMIGLPIGQVLGVRFAGFIPDECMPDFDALFARGWQEDVKEELLIAGATGRIPCQLSITALQMNDGKSLSVIVTDLSFQKETQAQLKTNNEQLKATNIALERSNYDLLQFASVASHDLQEPLRKIMVFTDMLRRGLDNGQLNDTGLHLSKIAASSLRMKSLIADILAYSRLSGDKPETTEFSLQELIEEIIEDFEILIGEKSGRIYAQGLPTISASRAQMRQVFQNLISNALKFSRPDVPPEIRISGWRSADWQSHIIDVADNGIGFNEVYADKIFFLFQRLNTKDRFEGSGIGLAVAKTIIEQHAGAISATSTEGAGSTFRIILPISARPAGGK